MRITLNEIAALLRCSPLPGPDGERAVSGVATLDEATENDVSFLGNDSYLTQFNATKAAGVIVHRRVRIPRDTRTPVLLVDDADLATAQVLEKFAPPVPRPQLGVDPLARVAQSATLDADIAIGPFVVIGERSKIGAGSVLHPGVYVGSDVEIGENCELFPQVVVRERISIGSRVIIHAGSILGSDGFGYRWDGQQHVKIPQIGRVVIEDDVEIGSCVCIDRAKFSTTRIGRGTKIDNLVQVGHNVQTGAHCIIVGQVGLAGSVKLGTGVVLGGQCAIRDHVTLGDGVMVAGCAGVAEDVPAKTVVSGLPALPHRQSLREQAALRRLPDLVVQARKLQETINTLRGSQSKAD